MEFLLVIAVLFMCSHVTLGHGDHGGSGKPLEFASEIHNKDHILDHLQHVISTKPKEQLTDEELEFHYFKLHDYDNNNKLDGVEIGKALTHFHDEQNKNDTDTDSQKNERPVPSEQTISSTIDIALTRFDKNMDGYIEYFEFSSVNKESRKD